ncbi:hypothetical protein P5673_033535 [Acropora cervicornis]|uniref:Uncharacterized protein n=1 Tax=Acropora cervicornis TaxID=6130 RepID=A0AAD9PPV3_ACRCE|nr:hypothetical protein P5673_033535 [Acropora cervicornis]
MSTMDAWHNGRVLSATREADGSAEEQPESTKSAMIAFDIALNWWNQFGHVYRRRREQSLQNAKHHTDAFRQVITGCEVFLGKTGTVDHRNTEHSSRLLFYDDS